MTFFLSLNEVEKARSMAERALRTINIREESEKMHVWVAYFNLENEYGFPPEDAVKYLEFEKSHGDEDRAKYVKAEALKFIKKF
uniref:Uncharacterized protein n=1 Tax=Lactuca sativa TaxID=4236 RepID=A0A9R1XD35_LACSA|nr:hypothetical protein LSAT_V11C500277070 [Lactuca sativa]